MKKAIAILTVMMLLYCVTALAEESVDGARYEGVDPWGNPLSITLTSEDVLSGVWREDFNGELFTQTFDNAQEGFAVEGPLDGSGSITCCYTGTMALDGDVLTVTFTDGEMTEESTEGGSTSYHVAALEEDQRAVKLVLTVQDD